MENKDPLNLKVSGKNSPIESSIKIGDETFIAITESVSKGTEVITRFYRKGEIIKTRKTLSDAGKGPEDGSGCLEVQHELALTIFKKEIINQMRNIKDYLNQIRTLLKAEKYRAAIGIVEEALCLFPEDPFLLSFSGYLEAKVFKNYRQGINACKDAITILGPKVPFGREFFLPLLYLNLGKAYLEADKKRSAVISFQKGLSMDPDDIDLISEMKKLGERKAPPIPFLDRRNPLNKYIGKVRHKVSRTEGQV